MVSQNLKTLRKANGYSQEELATRLNVVRQTISKWEKGLSVPDADILIRMSEIFEVSVSELLGENIELETETDALAEQLSRINEQLAVSNRRSRRIWKTASVLLCVVVLTAIIASIVNFYYSSKPDNNNTASETSGFGISADHARELYDTDRADYIKTQISQNQRLQNTLVIVKSGDSSPFRVDDSKTIVAVQITLNDDDTLTVAEIQAIIDLVQNAVPGVEPEDISIEIQ